jgi:hypothetical protein
MKPAGRIRGRDRPGRRTGLSADETRAYEQLKVLFARRRAYASMMAAPRGFEVLSKLRVLAGGQDCLAEVVDGVSGLVAAVSGPLGGCASD